MRTPELNSSYPAIATNPAVLETSRIYTHKIPTNASD
jgi:hypothetical protein